MKLLILSLLVSAVCCKPYVEQLAREYAARFPNTDQSPNPEFGDYFEGDIELQAGDDVKVGPFNAITNRNRRWTNNIVYYQVESGYTASEISMIQSSVAELVEQTKVFGQECIRVEPRTTQTNYVSIQKYSGCSSYVGMIGGAQRMSLVSGCFRKGTIIHEFLHAMGYHHEQTRYDRDWYVLINWDNIQSGMEYNFQMYDETQIDLLDTWYDYTSVMHYGAYGFAIDRNYPTIIPLDPTAEIGQRNGLSPIDIERVQIFYDCLAAEDSVYHKHLAE